MRSMCMQAWPALRNVAMSAPGTTSSRSASSSTISGFLPPSSRVQPTRFWPAQLADDPAGRGRAGEHHVVGVVDERRADVGALAADDLDQACGQAGLVEQLDAERHVERGLVVRLEHDAVAGDQRGHRVGEAGGEREVPRRDQPDDALGDMHLGGGRDDRHDAAVLLLLEDPLGAALM